MGRGLLRRGGRKHSGATTAGPAPDREAAASPPGVLSAPFCERRSRPACGRVACDSTEYTHAARGALCRTRCCGALRHAGAARRRRVAGGTSGGGGRKTRGHLAYGSLLRSIVPERKRACANGYVGG